MEKPPRKPGSQVPPNYAPHVSGRSTTAAHSKIPRHELRFRVRDEDWGRVFAEDVTWEEANKTKNEMVKTKVSRTVTIKDMAEDVRPEWAHDGVVHLGPAEFINSYQVPTALPTFELANSVPLTAPCAGVVRKIPAGHELLVNGNQTTIPASVQGGDTIEARCVNQTLGAARDAALRAASLAAAQANVRAAAPRYRDVTATPPSPPNPNPPRDKTVTAGVHVRLGSIPSAPPAPPPSPLKVAMQLDGAPLLDGTLSDDDLADLTADLGGGPSDTDIELAKRQREAERAS